MIAAAEVCLHGLCGDALKIVGGAVAAVSLAPFLLRIVGAAFDRLPEGCQRLRIPEMVFAVFAVTVLSARREQGRIRISSDGLYEPADMETTKKVKTKRKNGRRYSDGERRKGRHEQYGDSGE